MIRLLFTIILPIFLLQGCTTYTSIAVYEEDRNRPLFVVRSHLEKDNMFSFCEHISYLLERDNNYGLNMCGAGVKF